MSERLLLRGTWDPKAWYDELEKLYERAEKAERERDEARDLARQYWGYAGNAKDAEDYPWLEHGGDDE